MAVSGVAFSEDERSFSAGSLFHDVRYLNFLTSYCALAVGLTLHVKNARSQVCISTLCNFKTSKNYKKARQVGDHCSSLLVVFRS